MENDAKFYTEDPYVNQLQKDLEISEKRRKEVEIENAMLKRLKDNTGMELLLEEVEAAGKVV